MPFCRNWSIGNFELSWRYMAFSSPASCWREKRVLETLSIFFACKDKKKRQRCFWCLPCSLARWDRLVWRPQSWWTPALPAWGWPPPAPLPCPTSEPRSLPTGGHHSANCRPAKNGIHFDYQSIGVRHDDNELTFLWLRISWLPRSLR